MAYQKRKSSKPRKTRAAVTSTDRAPEPAECGIGAPVGDLTPELRQVMEDNSRALEEMSITSDTAMRLDSPLVLDAMPDEASQPSASKKPSPIQRCLAWLFGVEPTR